MTEEKTLKELLRETCETALCTAEGSDVRRLKEIREIANKEEEKPGPDMAVRPERMPHTVVVQQIKDTEDFLNYSNLTGRFKSLRGINSSYLNQLRKQKETMEVK